jgi:enterochelin esterase-like enzyme
LPPRERPKKSIAPIGKGGKKTTSFSDFAPPVGSFVGKSAAVKLVKILAAALALTAPARAQTSSPPTPPPAASPGPADTLVSPEVHADRRITFRLRAPKASQVTIAGEWTRPGARPSAPEKLTRDGLGIWSITVGPVEPNVYIYTFNVDGMTVTDPVNPLVKLRARTSASMVEVPARSGEVPWEIRDVPHGTLALEVHTAATLGGATRQIYVYTPPGYGQRGFRYPILYLLHGNNDLAVGWTMAGRANFILDNLIAEQKAVPMVVVMPWGHALPFGTRPPAGQPSNNDVFAQYLIKDVMPLIEAKYRVVPGTRASRTRDERAIVGLSMGGTQALQIGFGHRELFASIGVFGAGMTRADFEARYGAVAQELATGKQPIKFFYLGIGKEDGGIAKTKELADALTAHRQAVVYREVEGGHTYPVWRKLFADAAPQLFRSAAKTR